MSGKMRTKVHSKCKMRGYTLKVEALKEILSFLSNYEDAEDEALNLLLDELQTQPLKSSVLEKEVVQGVVNKLCEAQSAPVDDPGTNMSTSVSVIDVFHVPKFQYDPIRKMFCQHTGRLPLQGDAQSKAWLYRDRFLLLSQRLSRIPQFSKPSFSNDLSEFGSCEVQTFGFPPLEDREKSTSLFSGLDYFGGGTFAKEDTLRLAEMESRAVNEMFVILSDVWLDHEETMAKLETVLDGYEDVEVVPSLFVLMGNFCSYPCDLSCNSFKSIISNFAELGKMIASHQWLKEHSRFVFIPGLNDIGPSKALPRCPLPKYITAELQKHIPNAIFASNPCRIKFCTQEIVFFPSGFALQNAKV